MDFITTLKKLLAQAGNTYNNVVNAPFDRIGAEAKKINASIPQNLPVLERAITAAPQIARSISNNMYRDVPVAHQAFSYVGNRMAAPIADIPKSVMDLRTVPEMIKRRDYLNAAMTAASPVLNTAYAVGNIINPIGTQAANQIFTKFDAGKGVVNAIRNKQSPMGVADAALKGFTGENVVGLGDSLTGNRDLANKINMGESLAGLAIPAYHGIRGILKKGEVAPKPELVTAEKRIGLKPKVDPHILNQELPFTTDPVASGVKPENMFESKFSQTGVKKGKISEATKTILEKEPQMAERLSLSEQANKAINTQVTEDMVKRYTAPDYKFGGDINSANEAVATIRHLDINGRPNEAATIWNKLSSSQTEAGQFLNMGKLLLDMTPTGKVEAVKSLLKSYVSEHTKLADRLFKSKLSKFEISPEFESELKRLAVEVDAAKGTPQEQVAMKAFLEKAFGSVPPGVNDYVTAIRYNGLLSSPISFAKNAYSNLLQTGVFRPLDILTTKGVPSTIKYYAALLHSFKEARKSFGETFRNGGDIYNKELGKNLDTGTMSEYLRDSVSKKTRNIASLNGIPTRALEATDRFFQTLIKSGEIANGANEGQAQKIADKYLFREMLDPKNLTGQGNLSATLDKIGTILTDVRDVPVLGWTVPFIKTVINVSKEMLERSPAGFLNVAGNADKALAISKATTGTAALLGTFALLNDGNYETDAPKDAEEAKAWYASGRKAWSLKIGNEYIPINYFGMFAYPLAIAMIAKDQVSRNPDSISTDPTGKLVAGAAASLSFWLKNTPLQSINDIFDVLSQPDGSGMASFIASYGKQTVPASGLMRWIAQIVDPTYRKSVKGVSAESIKQQFMKDLPMLSMGLDPYTDPAGNPSTRKTVQSILALPYQTGTANPVYEPMVQQNIQDAKLNAQVKANEAMGAQTTPTPESQQTTEMSTIQSILAKKKIEEDKNKLIKSAMNLPPAVQVQMFKNYNITQDDVKNFELKQIKALNTDETATYIMGQKQNDFTKLYQQGVLTTSVAKMLEKKGYIPDASTLMDNLKKTDAYEQKQVMKKATKSYIKKIATLQKRNMKSILSKKSKTFKAPKARKFKAYKAPKIKIPKLKLGRKM